MDNNELVYSVPVDRLRAVMGGVMPQGMMGAARIAPVLACLSRHGVFLPRHEVEKDYSLKHIIVYSIITYDKSREGSLILSYRRSGGGEKRLDQKRSIGVGGHVNIGHSRRSDLCLYPGIDETRRAGGIIDECYKDELMEELEISHDEHAISAAVVGVVNDDSDDVGRVHLGIVYHLRFLRHGFQVMPRPGSGMRNVSMLPIAEVCRGHEGYEGWSQILIDQYIKPRYLPVVATA